MKSLLIISALASVLYCQQAFAGADPYASHGKGQALSQVHHNHGSVILPRLTRYYTLSDTGNMALNQLVNRVYSDLHLVDDANVEIVYQPGYDEVAEKLQDKLDGRFVDSALKTANNTSLRQYPVYITVRGWYGPETRCKIDAVEGHVGTGCAVEKTFEHTHAVSKR